MNPKANHGLFAAITGAMKPLNEDAKSLRLVKTHEHPSGAKAKVYKDPDWNEHRVKFFDKDGKHLHKADYHTDDVEDAHGTAQAELKRMNESEYDVYSAHKLQEHMDLALTARMMQRHKIPGHEEVFNKANEVLHHVINDHHDGEQGPLFHGSHDEALRMHKERIADDITAHHDLAWRNK